MATSTLRTPPTVAFARLQAACPPEISQLSLAAAEARRWATTAAALHPMEMAQPQAAHTSAVRMLSHWILRLVPQMSLSATTAETYAPSEKSWDQAARSILWLETTHSGADSKTM